MAAVNLVIRASELSPGLIGLKDLLQIWCERSSVETEFDKLL